MSYQLKMIPLGATDIQIPPIGIGAWQWGDRMLWGFGRDYDVEDCHAAFKASLESGIHFFDTAEVYGYGRSERLLGNFSLQTNDGEGVTGHKLETTPIVVATKFMPFPWRITKAQLLRALRNSLKRLGLNRVDLYQIHWPLPPISIETWAEALAEAVQQGLTRAVGVSNYNEQQMRRAYTTLAKFDIPLASNQVQYNLLDRGVEFNGLLQTCHELNITLIAYSPLAKGILTGKYGPDNPPPGIRARRFNRETLENIQPLIRKMRQIGREHDGKSIAQVALNWLISKGTVPIPGAKNADQVRDNAGALGWSLTEKDINTFEQLSEQAQ